MKEINILIYCVGGFYHRYKEFILNDYNVIGYIDACFTNEFNRKEPYEYSKIEDVKCAYDRILIMSEKPNVIYQALRRLEKVGVSAKKIMLGISNYGSIGRYFKFSVLNNYNIAVIDANESKIAHNESDFTSCLKNLMERNADGWACVLR